MDNHCSAECKRGALYPRRAADYLVKCFCFKSESIPVRHPVLHFNIIVVLVVFVSVVTCHSVNYITVNAFAQKLHRALDPVRFFEYFIVVNQYRGVGGQDIRTEQAHVSDICISCHIEKRLNSVRFIVCFIHYVRNPVEV
jgi:hypothetical protein